jgi:hypothetical protein
MDITITGKPSKRRHGTRSMYDDGCGCQICCDANAEYARRLRERLRIRPIPEGAHGKPSTYRNWSCRCDACRQAWSQYLAERRRVGA